MFGKSLSCRILLLNSHELGFGRWWQDHVVFQLIARNDRRQRVSVSPATREFSEFASFDRIFDRRCVLTLLGGQIFTKNFVELFSQPVMPYTLFIADNLERNSIQVVVTSGRNRADQFA